MSKVHIKVVGILFTLLLVSQVFAQGGATGAISGTVQDPTGAVIAGAQIRITNSATGELARTVTSNENGSFEAPLLPVGTYSLNVQSKGFSETTFSGVDVRITETTKITAKINTQSVQQNIEVQAQVQAVETTAPTTGEAIEASTIRALPLATQNFQQLLTLSSGAQSDLNASAALGRGDARPIVNGQREDNNNYLIEGISATDYNVAALTSTPLPNPDVVQEFKVQTSLYDASQGRNGGGNINAILKSGTKSFHGDAYEFFRNDVLNANEYFNKRAGQSRPVVKQNIFGGSFGGPLLPDAKLGFFFVNYQGSRQRSGLSGGTFISTTLPVLPTDRSPASLEAAFGVPSIDPVAAALLSLKSDQFGSQAGGYLFPSGNAADGSFVVSKPGKFTDDQFTANWDKEFRNSLDKVSVRFFYSNSEQDVPFGAGGLQASLGASIASTDLNFPYNLPLHDRFLSVAETHLFSSTLVNDFRFGYVRIFNQAINVNPAGATASGVGIDRPTSTTVDGKIFTDSIYKFTLASSGFQFGPTPQANQSSTQDNLNFVENLSWVRGAHTFRFGGEYTRVNLDKLFPQVFNGQLFFVNGTLAGDNSGTQYSDFQKFLLGGPDFSFGGGGVYDHTYKQNDYAGFIQDDWKATPDVTLNLGLRMEFLGAFKDNNCHIGNIETSLTKSGQYPFIYPKCVNKLGVTGLTGNADGSTFRNSIATGIGPRLGFAWDLFGQHKTTLRGGYGIYYVREDVGAVDQLSFQSPFIPIVFFPTQSGRNLTNFFGGASPAENANAVPHAGQLSAAWLPCLSQLTGFSSGTDNAGNYVGTCTGAGTGIGPGTNSTQNLFVLEVPRHFQVPNTQQWNLTLQRDLGRQWVVEVGYIGARGTHLRETRDAIQSANASPEHPFAVTDTSGNTYNLTTNTFNNAIARTPTPGLNGYSGYQLFGNDASSIYHSLQSTLSRRWGKGYFQAAYTYSKSIDTTSTGNTAFNTAYNDQSNINASRGLSDYDRPHRLTVSYVYDLPIFDHASGILHSALGGWTVSGETIVQSGTPFSIFDSGAATGFLGAGSTPLLGASLNDGASLSSGNSHGSIKRRLDRYVLPETFAPAPQLYPNQCQSDGNFCTTGFGDLGRNIYRGPYQQNWDISLIKYFHITETQNLRFTADFFNIWNHTNFANPAVTDIESAVCSPDPGNPACVPFGAQGQGYLSAGNTPFGRIVSSKGTPRLIQFSLRWAF